MIDCGEMDGIGDEVEMEIMSAVDILLGLSVIVCYI